MVIQIVERGSPEWDRMWSLVGEDRAEECPETGEVWHYMGTIPVARHAQDVHGDLMHQFRHRSHPEDGKRRTKNIPASTMTSWEADAT